MNALYKMSPRLLEKLQKLLASLRKAKKSYEQIAQMLKDRQLQHMLFGLALESTQYAHELDSYVQTLGVVTEQTNLQTETNDRKLPEKKTSGYEEKDIINWCTKSEKYILQVYRDLLNEPFLYEGVRKMLRYQLNGLLHSFSQLKLLKAALRTA
ncbi:MAG: DUF2383 domain-containing protein [Chitinophagales bacterium]